MEQENNKQQEEKVYLAPDFEVIEIEFEQNILGGSNDQLDDYDWEDW